MTSVFIGSHPTSCDKNLGNKLRFPEWVILHVPHDSTVVPAEVVDQFILGPSALELELLRMTDRHTQALFCAMGITQGQVVRAPVSRIVVDVERFEDVFMEPMVQRGMGAIYTKTSEGAPLRRHLELTERNALIDKWYRPHHERLTHAVEDALVTHGRALVIDAHSFPSAPLPYESDPRVDRPQICIGTDDFHTSKSLAESFVAIFGAAGFDVRLNSPFAGALVPASHYRRDRRVAAVMVEVNRDLYMDEKTGERRPEFDAVAARICRANLVAVASWHVGHCNIVE